MTASTHLSTAVLIDGENTSASAFVHLQAYLNAIPGIAITRVYGDFSNAAHAKWLDICRTEGLEAVLHCSPVTGKNGTDILMTIAAMDILATGKFRRIVLVSNDSDFLALAHRLRAGGIEVIGIGCGAQHSETARGAYSCWIALPAPKKRKLNTRTKMGTNDPFLQAVVRIVGEQALALNSLGQLLRNENENFKSHLGNGKLKRFVLCQPALELDGNLVRLKVV